MPGTHAKGAARVLAVGARLAEVAAKPDELSLRWALVVTPRLIRHNGT
jgi:hypothetical protein